MSFKDLQLSEPILKSLTDAGYTQPTPVQNLTIPAVLNNKDVVVSAQTGTGKTAAFALPIIQKLYKRQDASKKGKKIRALIVSPTRELALQTGGSFKTYGKHSNLRNTVIFGGVSIEPQRDVLIKGVDILIATPGRLLDLHKQDLLNLDYIEILVLDEADLMLDLGFINDVRKIERLCPENKQTLLFSATIPEKVEQLAKSILKTPERIEVSPNSKVSIDINQSLYYVSKRNKIKLCLHLLRNSIKGRILIFRRTKFGVDKLEKVLIKNGYKIDTILGNKSQEQRLTAYKKFKSGYINLLIATDVAARGLDINELDAVINFDMPNIPETYVHRIGRTGRAGNQGRSFSFCSADEKNYIKGIENLIDMQIPIENHPFPLNHSEKPLIHKKKSGSKYKKGRKSVASKKKKKRWY